MIPPDIFIQNAFLKYEGNVLFDHLNLKIPAGKFTCLLGPSGVGKSTLLRFIAQLIPKHKQRHFQCQGTVRVEPHLDLKSQLSYLAQENPLLPWLNAKNNALIGFKLRGEKMSKEVLQTTETLFKQMGLEKATTLYPHQLSGGMRQRVALIRIFLENRPIILMDEPFSALDAITRFELQTLIGNLLKNRTVFFVTHDPLEACRLADDIVILEGKPVQIRQVLALPPGVPRHPLDTSLLKFQTLLYEALLNAKEQTK